MDTYGLTASQFGLVFAAIAACSAAGNLANARLVKRWSLPALIGGGVMLGSAALALSLFGWALGFADLGADAGPLRLLLLLRADGLERHDAALAPHLAIIGAASAALGVIRRSYPLPSRACRRWLRRTARPALAIMLGLVLLAGLVWGLAKQSPGAAT